MKLLILITAYNVENFLSSVVDRLPIKELSEKYNFELLIIDDNSKDQTKNKIIEIKKLYQNLKINYLFNKENQGYGGNQKIGYYYAIKYNFDFVVLLHGDGQYAPEKIIDMIKPFHEGADAVQGSRMINKLDAIKGGMPIYKFFGNIFLTFLQNRLIKNMNMSEYHSGYRAYSVSALREIPFFLNSRHFHFDTEILIQLKLANKKIKDIPIPTFYGKESSSLNTVKYGFAILKTTLKFYLQNFSIFYEKKYDLNNFNLKIIGKKYKLETNYVSKLSFFSTHSVTFSQIPNNSRIISLGCGEAFVENKLKDEKKCFVVGIDNYESEGMKKLNEYKVQDLNNLNLDISPNNFDYIICLDVIEHMHNPELFLKILYDKVSLNPDIKLLISTPNVANIFIRIMLLFGNFNYGRRGILDKTHTRLFTKKTFFNILDDSNFKVISKKYVPIPFPLVIKNKFISNILMKIFKCLNVFFGKLFAFQFIFTAKPLPSLDYLLLPTNNNDEVK